MERISSSGSKIFAVLESLAALKADYAKEVSGIKQETAAALDKIRSQFAGNASALKDELDARKYVAKSALFDAHSRYQTAVDRCRDAKNQVFVTHVQKNRSLRNGRTKLSEDIGLNFRNYIYKFK